MSPKAKLDINSASLVQLLEIKGFGRSRAEEIVRYRGKHGPFASLDDLNRVPHVGNMRPGELDRVKEQLTVRLAGDAAPPTAPADEKVDVNSANVEELRAVKGIGFDRAQEIVQHREQHGRFHDLNELDMLPHFRDEPEGQRAPIKARLKV
jgi:competence protein ComEA